MSTKGVCEVCSAVTRLRSLRQSNNSNKKICYKCYSKELNELKRFEQRFDREYIIHKYRGTKYTNSENDKGGN